jgi:hypothetical protein
MLGRSHQSGNHVDLQRQHLQEVTWRRPTAAAHPKWTGFSPARRVPQQMPPRRNMAPKGVIVDSPTRQRLSLRTQPISNDHQDQLIIACWPQPPSHTPSYRRCYMEHRSIPIRSIYEHLESLCQRPTSPAMPPCLETLNPYCGCWRGTRSLRVQQSQVRPRPPNVTTYFHVSKVSR